MRTQTTFVFFDTTLRDGEQSPGWHHAPRGKAPQWPIRSRPSGRRPRGRIRRASDGDFNAVQASLARSRAPYRLPGPRQAEDIEPPPAPSKPAPSNRIHVFLASSDLHLGVQARISREQALDQSPSPSASPHLLRDSRVLHRDGTRTDHEFLIKMITVAIQAGHTTINIPDTVGYTLPPSTRPSSKMVKARALVSRSRGEDAVFLSTTVTTTSACRRHSLAGVEGEPARSSAPSRIGERAGNAALEEIAAALMVRRDKFPYTTILI